MIKIRMAIRPMAQLLFTVTTKPENTTSPPGDDLQVEQYIRRLENQFQGDDGTKNTDQQEVDRISSLFVNFLQNEQIDAIVHLFVDDNALFVAQLMVPSADAMRVQRWFKETFEDTE